MEKSEIEAIVREVLQRTMKMQDPQKGFDTTKGQTADGKSRVGVESPRTTMPLVLAVKLIEKIEAKAAEWDMRVVTAVSDASGRPVAVHCMDGAYIGSFDVALNKTYTSIAFQMSTEQLGTLSQPGESLYGIQFTNGGRIVIFGGGELLVKNGTIVGALGVSGGSAKQDTALAAYGREIFKSMEQEV